MSVTISQAPKVTAALVALDLEARRAAGDARDHTVAAVRRTVPARTGRLAASIRGSVTRTAGGYSVTTSPSTRVRYRGGVSARQVAGWVEEGTGVYGPRRRAIRPRRAEAFHLPGGWRSGEIEGQRARHPFRRVQTFEAPRVQAILERGAADAARAMESAL